MVLPNSPPGSANKENIKSSSSALREANGRRPRSHSTNPSSPVIAARQNARHPRRRHMQALPINTTVYTLQPAVEATQMTDPENPAESNRQQQFVQLPKYLRRPAFQAILPAALEAIDASLKGVALEYIHEKLQSVGQDLLAVSMSTAAKPPRNSLPRELDVVVHDLRGDPPTHLIAIYSRPVMRVSIHPAHALVLAAHCARLPILPYSKPVTPSEVGSTFTLPVIPLCLPNLDTFPILLRFLYNKRGEQLLASLLPMPPRDTLHSAHQLSQLYATTFSVHALLSQAAKVHGLWSNASALGVFDETLWRVIEMVWEVLFSALAISVATSRQPLQPRSAL